MKNEQGFSLVELLIVVAIIAIIAAIAVPSLLTSRMSANEAAGIQACRTLGSAEIAFSATANQQYASLANLVAGGFVDSRYIIGTQTGGYIFSENVPITDPTTSAVIGGSAPALFGFHAAHVDGTARYDYEIGADQVVRWGTVVPATMASHNPIAK